MNSEKEYTVYTSEGGGILSTLRKVINEFPRSREIGFRFFKRDVKARYRNSLLGIFWAIFPPVLTAGLWVFLKSSKIANFQETEIPYPLFVFSGTLLWQIFVEAFNSPLNIITNNRKVIVKINMPIESLLLAGLYDVFFKTTIKLGVLILVLFIFKANPGWEIMLFPVGILVLILFGFTLGLLFVPIGMLYNDIKQFLAVGVPVLMYLTPVVYPVRTEGTIGLIMRLNPMNTLITTTRNWATGQYQDDYYTFFITCLITLFLLVIGLIGLRKSLPIIIERIGS